jgi:acetyltransferase-like isoleucine patch superfamily enzyme
MRYNFPMIFPVAISRIWDMIKLRYCKLCTQLLAWVWGVRHGKNLLFQGKTIIRTRKKSEIVLGDSVVFNSNPSTNLVGLINPTILDTRFGGRIEIGDRTGASSVVISSKTLVKIGSRCKIGGNVRIFDHDFHSLDASIRCTSEDRNNIRSSEIEIGDDCFIGTNSILLKGTKIGACSIVAAGSVVFGLQVPPDSLVKGNPAQVVNKT